MAKFFKGFGKGILYLFVLPFCLVFLTLFGVMGIFMVIFLFIKSIVLFFQGRSLNIELPEDEQAKRILIRESACNQVSQEPVTQNQPIEEPSTSTGYQQSLYQATFAEGLVQPSSEAYQYQEPIKEEPKVEENTNEVQVEEPILDEEELEEVTIEKEVEEIAPSNHMDEISLDEQYVPRTPKQEEYVEDSFDNGQDDIDITFNK